MSRNKSWLLLALVCVATAAAAEPWRVGAAVGVPAALALEGDQRTRYEFLDAQFRGASAHTDAWLVLRTRLRARLTLFEGLVLGAELQDSRAHVDTQNAPFSTGVVNAAELLRAYLELSAEAPWGGRQTAQFGRLTMDVGSRRLVARNRFRNTANAFTGIDWRWRSDSGSALRAFFTLPVVREPMARDRLADNEVEFDEESFDRRFWGVFADTGLPGAPGDRFELFLLGSHRHESNVDRDLYTPGFRLRRARRRGHLDYEVETALQFGDNDGMSHFAHFHHAEIAFSLDAPASPRVALQYDYASGSDRGDSGRFDTLFGARRFEFGPTSLLGAFARSNLNTPGVRIQLEPLEGLSSTASFRAFWLADGDDAWTTAGIAAPAAASADNFVGTQFELRVRYDLLPGNVRLELGYAHLFPGDFVEQIPGLTLHHANYVYTQIALGF